MFVKIPHKTYFLGGNKHEELITLSFCGIGHGRMYDKRGFNFI